MSRYPIVSASRALLPAVLGLLALAGAPASGQEQAPAGADAWSSGVAARIGREVITKAEVWEQVRASVAGLGPEQREEMFKRQLLAMILEHVQDQAVARVKLHVDKVAIRDYLEGEKERLGGAEGYNQFLVERGLTEQSYIEQVVRDSQRYQYRRVLAGGAGALGPEARPEHTVLPTANEIRAWYLSHRDEYEQQEEIRVRFLAIKSADQPGDTLAAQMEAARVMAAGIVADLRTEADLAVIARNLGMPPETIGLSPLAIPRDRMIPAAIEEFALAAEAGSVSEPIPYPRGFFVVVVDERVGAKARSFAEVQEEIREELRTRKLDRATLDVQRKLLEDSYIWPREYKQILLLALRR